MQRNSPRFLRWSVGTDLALQCGLLLAVLLFGAELLPVVHGQMNKEEAGGSLSDDSLSQTHAQDSDSDDTEPFLGFPSFEPDIGVYEEIPFSTGDATKTPSADSEHGTKPPLLISQNFFSSKFPDVYITRLKELSGILSTFLMTRSKIKSARRIVKDLLEFSQQAESSIQKNAPKSVQLGEHEGPSVDLMSHSEQPSDSVEQQATSVPPGELENAEKCPAALLATCNQQKSQLEKELQEINAKYNALLAATNVSQQEHDDERKRLNTSLQPAWEQRTQLQNACQENDKTIASLNEEVRTKTVALDSVEQQLKEQINAMQQQADTHVATHASLTADAELQKRQSMIIYAVLGSVILLLCVVIVVLSCWVHHRRLNDITSSLMLLDSDAQMIGVLFDDSE